MAVQTRGVVGFNIGCEHSFPFSVVDFEQVIGGGDGHVEQGCCVGASLEWGRPDFFDLVVGDYVFGSEFCLRGAFFVQGLVVAALLTSFDVPVGFAVPDEDQSGHGCSVFGCSLGSKLN